MTSKQKIGITVLIAMVFIGFLLVAHNDLKIIQENTKATACASLNDDNEAIINCIADN